MEHRVLGSGTTQDVIHSRGTLPSFRLRLKMFPTIPHSWSAQDFRNLELMPSGPAAFSSLILRSWFLTWSVVRDRLEQGSSMVGDGCECYSQRGIGESGDGVTYWR